MKLSNIFYSLFLVIALIACIDQEFDEPPQNGADPDIVANATVADLLSLYQAEAINEVTDDLVINVVVTADDRSGNFYQTIIVEDESAGIALRLNGGDHYTNYPVGRRLFIKCQGLNVGDFVGLPQLGGNTFIDDRGDIALEGIADAARDNHILPGTYNNPVTPIEIDINAVDRALINRLVIIKSVKFDLNNVQTFADAEGQQSINQTLNGCFGGSFVVRTSGYSDFAGTPLPTGSGDVTGVYSVFDTDGSLESRDLQLILRDASDANLIGESCGDTGSGDNGTIADIKAAYSSGALSAPNLSISGTVISDIENGNITAKNLILQDEDAGIALRFLNDSDIPLNSRISVNVSGLELSEFEGLLQVNNVPNGIVNIIGSESVQPKTTTIQEIVNNLNRFESTLVKIEGVMLSGSNTYNGNLTVMDATGSIGMFTRSSASFSDVNTPTNAVDITAIVSQFTEPQIIIRSLDDVIGGNNGEGGGMDTVIVIDRKSVV